MSSGQNKFKYHWFSVGDIGAGASIVFDSLSTLTFMTLILQFGYKFPVDVIMTHIIPGTVIGLLVGNLLCMWLSFRIAKKEKRQVTAIPFGLDSPSAIGFMVCIMGPAFSYLTTTKGMDVHTAAIHAWQVTIGCLFITGLIKLAFSFVASRLKALIPKPALLGAIGGVAIALIGFFPIMAILKVPAVGLMSLAIVFLTMFAKLKLPFKLPGIPAAIIIGTIVYYVLLPFGLSGEMPNLSSHIMFLLPMPNIDFFSSAADIVKFLPVIIPFALLVVFGTMSVAESADCMGENYSVRDLMVIDSIATICTSLFGGVAQTTPYAGFPAFKKMDARAGFLLINLTVVGIGGIFGIMGAVVNFMPEAAVAPVLLFIAFEIALQGFFECEKKHYSVILFSFLPSIARLLQIKITDGSLIDVTKLEARDFVSVIPSMSDSLVIILLGNGFILTGMLWATLLYCAIEHKWKSGFICSIVLAILSYFGIIHSLYISGEMYLPSRLPATIRSIPLELAIGYLLFGFLLLFLSKLPANRRLS